jgi:signal transduction histidine kinase
MGTPFVTIIISNLGLLGHDNFTITTTASIVFSIGFFLVLFTYVRSQSNKRHLESLALERIKIREEFAQDLHDEIGNRLAKIIAFSNALEYNNYQLDDQTRSLINRICSNSQQLYQSAYDIIRSKQSDAANLDSVINHLKQFGEELFKDTPINFSADIEVSRSVKLAQGNSRQISLILKEAMTNALKHSQCQNVTFKARVGYAAILELIDNGKGFSVGKKPSGMGLSGIMNRAKKINATVKIDSTTKGTKLKLLI